MSFRLKIFSALMGAQLVLLLAFSWVGDKVTNEIQEYFVDVQNVAHARLLGLTLADSVQFYDFARIDEAIVSLVNDEQIDFARVFGASGNILSHSGSMAGTPPFDADTMDEYLVRLQDGDAVSKRITGVHAYLVPITRDGVFVGALELHACNKMFSVWLSGVWRFQVLGLAICVIAALAASWGLSRRLSWRLKLLKDAANALGSGVLTTRVATRGSDEMSQLGNAFNLMASKIEETQGALEKEARTDQLTGVLSRAGMAAALAEITDKPVGRDLQLFHIDLDNFKDLNDGYGHGAGDAILQEVACRLYGRFYLPEEAGVGFVARVGGDEFVGLRSALARDDIADFAQSLLADLSHPTTVNGELVSMRASVGIANLDHVETRDFSELFAEADIALYAAKSAGGNQAVHATPEMLEAAEERQRVLKDVKKGLDNNEFQPFLQPQIDISTNQIVGFELLARWQHPDRGLLSPFAFIPHHENSYLVHEIDERLRKSAFEWLAKYKALYPKLSRCRIGINIIGFELNSEGFAENLLWQVEAAGLSPKDIGIEVLENVLFDQQNRHVHASLNELAKMGFSLELDDFGTEHSAISNLMCLDVERVKIDRSFVSNVDTDAKKQALLTALVSASKAFGASVLVEGVETSSELSVVRRLGCDAVQGFHIARAMNLLDAAEWVTNFEMRAA